MPTLRPVLPPPPLLTALHCIDHERPVGVPLGHIGENGASFGRCGVAQYIVWIRECSKYVIHRIMSLHMLACRSHRTDGTQRTAYMVPFTQVRFMGTL